MRRALFFHTAEIDASELSLLGRRFVCRPPLCGKDTRCEFAEVRIGEVFAHQRSRRWGVNGLERPLIFKSHRRPRFVDSSGLAPAGSFGLVVEGAITPKIVVQQPL